MGFDLFLFPEWHPVLAPRGTVGWLAWFILLAGLLGLTWRGRKELSGWGPAQWRWFAGLALATPLAAMLLVVRLPADGALPIPLLGGAGQGPLVPLLAAAPWMLAGASLGSAPAMLLGGVSGLLFAGWDTRSPFTPFEFALLAALFAAAVRQGFRTRFFTWLRQPLVAALVLATLYPFIVLSLATFWAGPSLVTSLDFTLSRLAWLAAGGAVQFLLGASLVHLFGRRLPQLGSRKGVQQPSPAERSLEARLLFALGPVVAGLFLVLGVVIWVMAGQAADQLLSERMRSSASSAAEGVPFLLETGQSLILQLAQDPTLLNGSSDEIRAALGEHLRAVPYFEQFVLVGPEGESIAGFPVNDLEGLQPGPRELDALALAFEGIPLQYFSIAPLSEGNDVAQLSFVAALQAGDGSVPAVLLGRTQLSSNPFAQPILQNLREMQAIAGQGILLDGDGQIVYHPNPASLLAPYNAPRGDSPLAYEDTGSDGARRRVVYQPATGSNWAVVTQLPVSAIQQWGVDIALPMLAILALAALLAYVLMRHSLRTVTASLQDLVQETRRIAAGDLDAPLTLHSADEIGRLGQAFERMRQALKERLEEIQRLLSVSQGVAGSLELNTQIDPVLDAALASGACAVRLAFSAGGAADGQTAGGQAYGRGPLSEVYRSLDAQMLELTEKQPRVLITNPARARLKLGKEVPQPQALAAFALQHENQNLGALWLAFDQPQTFEVEAVRYLETLARQAALAAANAGLYLDARLGRQRVEAVLAATPDPVLVTDQAGRLLLANPAAARLLNLNDQAALGKPLVELVPPDQTEFIALLSGEKRSAAPVEVNFPDGRIFYATATDIEVAGQPMGRTCVLREVTEFKQVEALRSEFLSTVSHDLRDPLDLTRGYLSMLDMVGSLNEKQAAYAQKIEQSVEGMSKLVSNLLDLERIQSGQGLQVETFAIGELLAELKQEFEPRALQKQVEIKLELADDHGSELQADRTLLQRAFYNLLDNAIKFSPRETQVEIWVSPSAEALTLGVRDHGAGIAPVDLPHVFDRMARPGKGDGGQGGGLGLAIVKSIIERHGGRVWVESELGLGSTFYCRIPLRAPTKAN